MRFGKGALQDSSSGNWNIDIVNVYQSATKLSIMLQNSQLTRLPKRFCADIVAEVIILLWPVLSNFRHMAP